MKEHESVVLQNVSMASQFVSSGSVTLALALVVAGKCNVGCRAFLSATAHFLLISPDIDKIPLSAYFDHVKIDSPTVIARCSLDSDAYAL